MDKRKADKIQRIYHWIRIALIAAILLLLYEGTAKGQTVIRGQITDAETREALIGASVTYAEGKGTITDIDGAYQLTLGKGTYRLTVSYIGYQPQTKEVSTASAATSIDFALLPENASISTVTVVAEARHNTEASLLKKQQESPVTMTVVSEQQIKRTQDKDASEVVKRIPGVSIIDEKFVMVRGLSQRYNNVWMNGSAVPSSEADQRAFSFDIIPSSQIDNITIVKSASPEYPSDFTGGFIIVNTKDVPHQNTWSVTIGGSYNSKTHLKSYSYYDGSPTDFIGFDSRRGLKDGIGTRLNPQGNGYSLVNNGLSNNWEVKTRKPIADFSMALSLSHRWSTRNSSTIGLNGNLNYSHTYRSLLNITNNMFGAYDVTHNCSNYLRRASDDQYTSNVRLGALLGLVWLSSDSRNRIELKQIFNQLGKNRYTYRHGFDAQSDYTEQAEYYYQSRRTYNVGLAGKHTLSEVSKIDWSMGYAYANRNLPDRRRYTIVQQDDLEMAIENLNDINREFSYLGEHIYSAGANWERSIVIDQWKPTIKVGLYGEHKNRTYNTRFFTYAWPHGQLSEKMRRLDVSTQLLTDDNYGPDGLYMLEQVDWSNNYEASNSTGCGYASLTLPFFNRRLEAFGGIRFESSHTELTSNTRRQEYSPISTRYNYNDIFPSLSLTYHINNEQQVRTSYGRTTNRPEFRELSTSVYYDFDLASNVQGNHKLRSAYMHNIDCGWEWYPNHGEVVSVSVFYKHFSNPIEWTYTVAGGTDLVYSYMNAENADNYGIEIDIRKQLDFIRMPQLSVSLNVALIKSGVNFPPTAHEKDRPMQGQSPYLVNAGIFYNSDNGKDPDAEKTGWTAALLYNTIGKRIIGVGRSVGSGETDVRVPDSYEMPRHQIDMNVGKSFNNWNIRLSLKDLLSAKVQYRQSEKISNQRINQTTRSFTPGRTVSLALSYNFR